MEKKLSNVVTMAETLNSLAMNAPEETPLVVVRSFRKGWVLIGLAALLAGSAITAAYRWDDLSAEMTSLAALLPWADPAQDAGTPADATATQPQSAAAVATVPAPVVPTEEITGSGYVIARNAVTVYAPGTDRIAGVRVAVGDIVQAGQPLILLEGAAEIFARDRARIARDILALEVEARRADLALARDADARSRQLSESGAVTRSGAAEDRAAFDKAGIELARAERALAQSALDLREADHAVGQLTLRAPFAGTVTEVVVRTGQTVFEPGGPMAGDGSLLTIVDMAGLAIDADFAERSIGTFRPGVTAEAVLDAFPDQPFALELERIAPVASAEKGTIGIRFRSIDPPPGTRPNMAVRIRVVTTGPGTTGRSN
jgi:RND family efflux transporter MFP subunit